VSAFDLLNIIFDAAAFQKIPEQLSDAKSPLVLTGITPAAKALYLSALWKCQSRPLLFLTRPGQDLLEFRRALEFYHGQLNGRPEERLALFPGLEPSPYSGLSPHAEILEERALALWKSGHQELDILISSPSALFSYTFGIPSATPSLPELRQGAIVSPEALAEFLLAAGYIREEPVTSVGTFSTRGGIFDFFPPTRENPVRLEFYGDEIESLREFSPKSQRSIGPLPMASPIPMREWLITPQLLMNWSQYAEDFLDREISSESASEMLKRASMGEQFPGMEHLLPLAADSRHSLLEWASDYTIVMDEPALWTPWIQQWQEQNLLEYQKQAEAGFLAIPPATLFPSIPNIRQQLISRQLVLLDEIGLRQSPFIDVEAISDSRVIQFSTCPAPKFHGNIRRLTEELEHLLAQSGSILFIQSNRGKAERLQDILHEYDCPVHADFRAGPRNISELPPHSQVLTVGEVLDGFQDLSAHLWICGDRDIYDEEELLSRPPRKKQAAGSFLSDFRELKPGDYVVHIDHGIGQFYGIREITAEGITREFMVLNYAGDDKLYVPLERLDLIQKHSSSENLRPSLDKLGGTSWIKTKARIRKSMRDMADELLKLYATRKITPGFSFSAQGHWHEEFEDAFEFVETTDQINAIKDVCLDMEEPTPMDRLLCGDVGFGKTEVAMRAAFKAAFDGKQVAVLAPTTILVYQHYLLFKQRFTTFPMTIEMLSRFRDRKEQKKVVEGLANGQVDIIIGTHRLFSKDVQFRDLGLLIVDEEQQFGVAHKEKLKHLKKHVDTLTMSATPIPRTLHMSLCGIRDMSVIETPPRDRLAIQTAVVAFSRKIIQTAIDQEMERGGQVYFVHNRVENIYAIASMIQEICPKARIVVGHGQMDEKSLESAMLRFVRHEADILVSTTIIENGLDIPLVNTIIVNHADRFGLAQLYQLRGRVGRSSRRAYAYLLVPGDKVLTGEARQRLAALKEFSELGAGFKIAALDLELRGAGNLLGGEQHGHINAVGFDLYCQMLERTIEEMKGTQPLPEIQTQLNLRIPVKIPMSYIPDENQRLRTYKRISSLKSDAEVSLLRAELEDRYGPLPDEVENLMEYARLRLVSERCLVKQIERKKDAVIIQFHEKTPVNRDRLVEVISRGLGISLTPEGNLKYCPSGTNARELLPELRSLLLDLTA
jgi:transcription-repair coupling factor (superfamily II helicase)